MREVPPGGLFQLTLGQGLARRRRLMLDLPDGDLARAASRGKALRETEFGSATLHSGRERGPVRRPDAAVMVVAEIPLPDANAAAAPVLDLHEAVGPGPGAPSNTTSTRTGVCWSVMGSPVPGRAERTPETWPHSPVARPALVVQGCAGAAHHARWSCGRSWT